VRVTFQRLVWQADGKLSKSQPLQEPEQYEEFFDRLARAVFLHVQDL
jgi:hypothetical protein